VAHVPAVVKATIEKETAGDIIKGIVKNETDGKVCYVVEYVKDGMEKTVEFTEEGKRR
jgi:acylphosphatase